jgi:hypothetical protein
MRDAAILVDEATGVPLVMGQPVVTFRGEPGTLVGWEPPYDPDSNLYRGAKVYIRMPLEKEEFAQRYFPSVIGAKFILNQ